MNYAAALSDPIFHLISQIARENNQECFVVGGFVRDLLLSRGQAKDIDIVTLGSGISLAEKSPLSFLTILKFQSSRILAQP